MRKEPRNIRCYPIQTYQNEGKNIAFFELYKEYRKYYKFQIKFQYELYQKTGKLDQFVDTKEDKTSLLSERYKRVVVKQAVGQLQSWISNRDNQIKSLIHNCDSLKDEEKRVLHLIRKMNIKDEKEIVVGKNETILVEKKYIQIYKSILRQVKWRLPSSKNISMQLNDNVCKLILKQENSKNSKNAKKGRKQKAHNAKSFEYWFELSTLVKGKKTYIPAKMNSYLKEKLNKGKLLNAVRIDFKKSGKDYNLVFNLMVDKEKEEYKNKIKSIGIDFGTKNLFSLSTGNIFGVGFGKKLASYDEKITLLQKRLQQQKIKPNSSKRYRRLVFKCREYIRNEINRNFNKIIREIKPQEIVLEKLDFRNSKLNKTMNRILRKCGRSVVRSKLQTLEKDFGINVVEVNPAYTSQACNKCGFVHKLNRKNRDEFKCNNCNYKKHADVNAARNISSRSSCSVLRSNSAQRTIKKHLFDNFKKNILQCDVGDHIKYISSNSRALFLDFNPVDFSNFYDLLKSGNQLKIIS